MGMLRTADLLIPRSPGRRNRMNEVLGSRLSARHLPIRSVAFAALCVSLMWVSIGAEAASTQATPSDRSKQEAPALDRVETVVATTQWAVRLDPSVAPDVVAAGAGFRNLGQIGTLEGFYLFEKLPEPGLSAGFEADVASVERVNNRLDFTPGVRWFGQQLARRLVPLAEPTDPLYSDQWHLKNTGQSGGTASQDVNVVPAWTAGYTGAGATIAIVDDGLEHSHPDFNAKYVPSGSWDFNGGDADPNPVTLSDEHGTAVGGVAAADDDGGKCGVGSAFGAGISGIRLISGYTTDAQEASALTYAYQINDVYNSSWGPLNWLVGPRLAGPGPLTQLALEDGVAEGRGGSGSIYVFAAGNGLNDGSDVNYNGFANSRYTIAVGATDHNGVQSYYSEPGAAMLVNASSGGDTPNIITTDRLGTAGYGGPADSDCTNQFSGTSSASPLAAGVVALMLDANPDLTWRDVQHILVQTAEQNDPGDSDWTANGAGLAVNHKYGFGRIDATAATAAAVGWARAQDESTASTGVVGVGVAIPDDNPSGVSSTIAIDSDMSLEHVEVILTVTHPYRGDLRVVLTSPDGTESILAERHNDPGDDYQAWKFMSVRHWGESPVGNWTLEVSDRFSDDEGFFESWQLVLHGTTSAISGRVTEAESEIPLTGIDVSVVEAVSGDLVGTRSTDGSGAYVVGGLAVGDYRVRFSDPSGRHFPEWFDDASTFSSATPVAVTLVSVTQNIDAAMTVNHPPTVTGGPWSVPESALPGAVVGTVRAVKDPGEALAFSITSGNSGGAFGIDETSGELTVVGALDHETAPSYTLTVSVDDGLRTDTAAVKVAVTDVNEAPTASNRAWSIAENTATGTVLGTVGGSDVDGDRLSFIITGGNRGGAFEIDSSSGEVAVSGVLDFETRPAYVLEVSVSDGKLFDTATVSIEVTDVTEFELPSSASFLDVPAGHSFFPDIEWMAWEGVTLGCNPPTNDLYCPDNPVTRGQMAAFLHRALGHVLTPADPVQFTDDNGSVFESDIEWLGATGITRGCNPPANTLFCPDDPVTRGQMAAFLVRALGYSDDGGGDLFTDDDGSVFEGDIDRLGTAGVTKGCNPPTNTRFCPKGYVTRGQMAAFLHRALG